LTGTDLIAYLPIQKHKNFNLILCFWVKFRNNIYLGVVLTIDGNRSLRSLAINNHQSVLNFTSTILPLLRSRFISLSPQPKSRVSKPNNPEISNKLSDRFSDPINTSSSLDNSSAKQAPLIACIDNSILIYQSLERLLTEYGYRSYGVQDPLRILPSLIRNKPDFIFLDLLILITNGYEVCGQIRKTPSLKYIPVIILTGKDGSIECDRE